MPRDAQEGRALGFAATAKRSAEMVARKEAGEPRRVDDSRRLLKGCIPNQPLLR